MVIAEAFKKLATKQKTSFEKIEKKYALGDGSYLFSAKYLVNFTYKEQKILIKNELGHQNLGYASCFLPLQIGDYSFEITTKKQLSQLLNPRKAPLSLTSNNVQLKKYLEKSAAFAKLCEHAKKERFEPYIYGKNTENNYKVVCKYSLVFNNKELVLEPLHNFFKTIIDFFEKNT